jgi:hypothetical protein
MQGWVFTHLGCLAALHALQNGCGKLHGAYFGVAAAFRLNGDAISLWEGIGNDLKFLAVEADFSGNGVTEMLDPITNFYDR